MDALLQDVRYALRTLRKGPAFATAAIGLATALALGRVIAPQLWQVSASNPATSAAVILLLLVTGLAACWVPALRYE